jgi:hypothetical protein
MTHPFAYRLAATRSRWEQAGNTEKDDTDRVG